MTEFQQYHKRRLESLLWNNATSSQQKVCMRSIAVGGLYKDYPIFLDFYI